MISVVNTLLLTSATLSPSIKGINDRTVGFMLSDGNHGIVFLNFHVCVEMEGVYTRIDHLPVATSGGLDTQTYHLSGRQITPLECNVYIRNSRKFIQR